jgi:uncharacterized protein YbdZ (MbtH family)
MITFEGRDYYFDKTTGYYKSLMRHDDREYLHRAMWRSEHGNIPHGWHVHHKNEDKDDNRIDNFECLPIREHNLKHAATLADNGRRMRQNLQITGEFVCEGCGTPFQAKNNGRNRWCSKKCANAYHNARAFKLDARQ